MAFFVLWFSRIIFVLFCGHTWPCSELTPDSAYELLLVVLWEPCEVPGLRPRLVYEASTCNTPSPALSR